MTVTAFDTSERRAWAAQADACAGSFGTLCAYPVPRLLAVATRNAATADVRPTVLPEPPSPTTRATR
ncbi:hypothetical protein OG280_01590 [Streptomyces virginiae]|uniref:hypothetical protein n=1 Tax=Streptomyces virginiae TaxID=1961 RepID=UPI002DDB828A|nr:hypothetical protein [Streptomyces virginiae]WSC81881.1 hypothetical protein OHA56_39185 [Streptomyces virginiae]